MRPIAPFQPKARYLPEDLRDYEHRSWWYLHRDKCVAIVCALLWALTLALPNAAQDAGPTVGAIPSASTAPVAAPTTMTAADCGAALATLMGGNGRFIWIDPHDGKDYAVFGDVHSVAVAKWIAWH